MEEHDILYPVLPVESRFAPDFLYVKLTRCLSEAVRQLLDTLEPMAVAVGSLLGGRIGMK